MYMWMEIVSVLAFPVFLGIFLIFVGILVARGNVGKLSIQGLFAEKVKVTGEGNTVSLGRILSNSDGSIPDENKISLLLEEYHNQGLHQSKISFWFSIISASIGFLVILYSIYLFLDPSEAVVPSETAQSTKESSWFENAGTPIFALVCGVVIDAVAGLFFVQSNKARQLMSEFFDRLRVDRKLDEALKLIGEIEDKEIAGRTQALLAVNLAEIQIDGPVYERMITGNYTKQTAKKTSAS